MNFINGILNLLYPPVCGFCDKINKNAMCTKCSLKIKNSIVCKIDYYSNKNFTKHMYIFKYNGIARDKIVQYKFNDKIYIYKSFVNLILKNKKIYSFLENYDIIVPVPISKKRKRKRGYNQCELIAKGICKNITTLTLEPQVLYKEVNNVQQSTLSKKDRINNVKNVYKLKNSNSLKNKKIVLLDDVFTTGNTVNECSRLLKLAGAEIVDVLTIAKD